MPGFSGGMAWAMVLLRVLIYLSVCHIMSAGRSGAFTRVGYLSFLSFCPGRGVYRRRDVYRLVGGMNVESQLQYLHAFNM